MDTNEMAKARRALDMRQLAKKFFGGHIAHHARMAKAHAESANDFEEGSSEHTFHSTAAKSHLLAGEEATECCQECLKTDFAVDLRKAEMEDGMIPTQVSAVAPTVPAGLRMVLRAGQQDYSRQAQPGTPTEFSNLVTKLTSVEE
jgi:hypothetical protein